MKEITFEVEARYDLQSNIRVPLSKLGYTEEQWNQADEEEREDAIIEYANDNLKRPSYTLISYNPSNQ